MSRKDDPDRDKTRADADRESSALERLGLQGILLALALASLQHLPDEQPASPSGEGPAEDAPPSPAGGEETSPGLEPIFALPAVPTPLPQARRTVWRRHWVGS